MIFKPHEYQRYAIDRMLSNPRVGLFQDMGLGKTVETLTAINELKYFRWAVSKVLVIAPKKVAEGTWQAEAAMWEHLKHLRVVSVLGSVAKREQALAQDADVWVINRENVSWLVERFRNAWPFDMVVVDESTSFKNPASKRFKSLKLVLKRITRLIILTGTPAPNGMEDLWAQVYLLDEGKRLGRTITSFREAFFVQNPSYPGQTFRTYRLRDGADKEIQAAISDICVSMKAEDYLELPEYVEDIIPVVLDERSKREYKRFEREAVLNVDGDTITAGTAAGLNGKLLQLCNGAAYDVNGDAVEIHRCKLDAFLETVERLNGKHALVFYWYKHDLGRLMGAVSELGLRVRVYSGQDDTDAWNRGEVDLLLAHPASCGYGLNLQQGGNHMIWFSLPNWALEVYQQACKRLHRQGQNNTVVSHILVVKGGMDEEVAKVLSGKGEKQDALMNALKARIAQAKKGEALNG